jgi:uncharacterized protein YoxC
MQLPSSTVLLIFTAVTALSFFLQAIVLVGMLVAGFKVWRRVNALTEEMSGHVIPLLTSTRHLLEDLTPRVKEAVANLTLATEGIRRQTENVNSTLGSITEKTRVQADRINGMITGTLDGLNQAASAVQNAVSGPARQVSGVFNGLRAGLDTLLSKDRPSHSPEDKDLFI